MKGERIFVKEKGENGNIHRRVAEGAEKKTDNRKEFSHRMTQKYTDNKTEKGKTTERNINRDFRRL